MENYFFLPVPLIALRRYNYGDDVNLNTIQKFKVALSPLHRNWIFPACLLQFDNESWQLPRPSLTYKRSKLQLTVTCSQHDKFILDRKNGTISFEKGSLFHVIHIILPILRQFRAFGAHQRFTKICDKTLRITTWVFAFSLSLVYQFILQQEIQGKDLY